MKTSSAATKEATSLNTKEACSLAPSIRLSKIKRNK